MKRKIKRSVSQISGDAFQNHLLGRFGIGNGIGIGLGLLYRFGNGLGIGPHPGDGGEDAHRDGAPPAHDVDRLGLGVATFLGDLTGHHGDHDPGRNYNRNQDDENDEREIVEHCYLLGEQIGAVFRIPRRNRSRLSPPQMSNRDPPWATSSAGGKYEDIVVIDTDQ
jgi:hypothetical protein